MKKKFLSIMVGVFAAVLVTGSVIYSQSTIPKEQIKEGFDEIQLSLESGKMNRNLAASSPVVVGDGIEITRDRFVFYKKSSELLSSLENNNNSLLKQAAQSDDDIINELIKSDLTVQNAKNLGLEATDQEINNAITAEKAALNDPDLDPDNYLVKELMSNRIRITGLTEDEFWNSEETRYGYEKAILLGKLFDQLVKEGKINDISEFNEYQNQLLEASKDKLEINYSVIK